MTDGFLRRGTPLALSASLCLTLTLTAALLLAACDTAQLEADGPTTAIGSTAAAKPDFESVCHWDAEAEAYTLLTLPTAAATVHDEQHPEDEEAGGDVLDPDCQPVKQVCTVERTTEGDRTTLTLKNVVTDPALLPANNSSLEYTEGPNGNTDSPRSTQWGWVCEGGELRSACESGKIIGTYLIIEAPSDSDDTVTLSIEDNEEELHTCGPYTIGVTGS